MSMGRSVGETTRTDQLSGIDHGILALLQAHRVLTTPQLITLTVVRSGPSTTGWPGYGPARWWTGPARMRRRARPRSSGG